MSNDLPLVEMIFLVSFFLGLGFAVLSLVLSSVFHGGGHDAGGDVHAHLSDGSTVDSGGGVHFPLLSPVTLSTFVATFGGTGIILMKLKPAWGWPVHVPGSLVAAAAVTLLVAFAFYKLFGNAESSSAPREHDLLGLEAEVTVTVPKEGAGQIRYLSHGSFFTGIARSEDKIEIRQGDKVRILRCVSGVCYVQKG